MRVLFYTATAFVIVLAGVFGFYAFQTPQYQTGAKVVLSIDSREAPGDAAAGAEPPERDLYAEAAARLKSIEAEKAPGKPDGDDVTAAENSNGDAPAAGSDRQDAQNAESPEAAPAQAVQAPAKPDPKGQAENIAGLPPGTALAGLDNDRPLFKNVGQDGAAPDGPSDLTTTAAHTALPGTQFGAPPSSEDASSTSSAAVEAPARGRIDPRATTAAQQDEPASDPTQKSAGLRLRQNGAADDTPPEAEGGQKRSLDAILAALNEREGQTQAATAPDAAPAAPPPVPLRRPNPKVAAANGWGNTKITNSPNATNAGLKPARVAILLRGLGRDDRNSSDAVTKLPPAISLAFMPFAGVSQQWAKKAGEQGHEVLVQLPLEPTDYPVNNPGPETLLASSAPDENTSRVSTILGRFEGYSGVTNLLGGKLLQSKDALRPILEDIKSRGLIYVGEINTSHAVVRGIAGEIGLRYGGADVMIDARPTPEAIQAALAKLIAIARKDGTAIGLGYASRATIEQLEAWTQTLSAQGVTLVPVGTLAQTPGAT